MYPTVYYMEKKKAFKGISKRNVIFDNLYSFPTYITLFDRCYIHTGT